LDSFFHFRELLSFVVVARCREHAVAVKEVGQRLGLEEDAVVRKGNGGGNTVVGKLRPESNYDGLVREPCRGAAVALHFCFSFCVK
jgi:hypothetical protein